MDAPDLIDRLAQHRTLAEVPRGELAWVAAHGYMRHVECGEKITTMTEVIDHLVVVLTGHMAIRVDRGFGPRKVMEWGPGDVSGFLPYSRMGKPPGDGVVDEAGDLFLVHRDYFPEMTRECPALTTTLVHVMLDRVRRFTSSDLLDEKMMSLGRLSAGLAHELNNPASAAARSARLLAEGLAELEDAARAVGALRLKDIQRATLDRVLKACRSTVRSVLSPIERADREDAISVWLDKHWADPDAAAALVETDVTFADLDGLAAAFDGSSLNAVLRWIAADCSARTLTSEVEKAATRVHDLVAAVKRFSYMDQTRSPEAIHIASSLSDSVELLRHKARKKSVGISINIEPDLPPALAIGSDLNQVWTNLIDNAIDAAPESGRVEVSAARQLDFVIVSIIDDGPGIPEKDREHIFEPFFTTKPPGQGTGLGLDIARQLMRQNNGSIEVESRPGRTEFRVTLRVAGAAA